MLSLRHVTLQVQVPMGGMAPNRAAAHSPAGSLPTTSSSGLLNDLEAGGRSNSFGQLYQQDESPDDMTTHREKNRLAQRKFRARQKVGALLCLASAASTALNDMHFASALHGPLYPLLRCTDHMA